MNQLRRSPSYYEKKYAETAADRCTQDLPSENTFDQPLVTEHRIYEPTIVQDCPSWCLTPKRTDKKPEGAPRKKKFCK